METLVSVLKADVEEKKILSDLQYAKYFEACSEENKLRKLLFSLWIEEKGNTNARFIISYSEDAELMHSSNCCIRYEITSRFCKNLNFDQIHISSKEEKFFLYIGEDIEGTRLTEFIIETFLNYNSLHLLYFGKPLKYSKYRKNLEVYKNRIIQHDFALDSFVIVSSGILGMYGMREPTDIDMVTVESRYPEICDELIDCHHHVLKTYEITVEELVRNPLKYVYWDGIKFAALDVVYKACNNRKENTKKLDGYFVRVIWGYENPNLLELTEKRIRHYLIRTLREWKKHHEGYYECKARIKRKIRFCFKVPYLVVRKLYRIIKNDEEDKS